MTTSLLRQISQKALIYPPPRSVQQSPVLLLQKFAGRIILRQALGRHWYMFWFLWDRLGVTHWQEGESDNRYLLQHPAKHIPVLSVTSLASKRDGFFD